MEKKTKHKTTRGDQPTHSVNKTTGEDRDELQGTYWKNEGWQIAKQTLMTRRTIFRQCKLCLS
jgi:hypothetical protein